MRWQKWRLRLGFTAREGLVLHTIGYEDGGRLRPVIHRASIAELVVPYGDPRPFQGWRNAFDIGEYGIGIMTNWLELGCDCLGEIRYFDVELADDRGEPYTIKNAICLHEEDHGILWKHFDARSRARRGAQEPAAGGVVHHHRRATTSTPSTGTSTPTARSSWRSSSPGSCSPPRRSPEKSSDYGTVVAPQTLAAHHQHFFSVRLDMAVDGPANSVYEVETEPWPAGPDNPYRQCLPAAPDAAAHRVAGAAADRPAQGPALARGQPQRDQLAGPAGRLQADPATATCSRSRTSDSSVIKRGAFMTRHLWVTPFAPASGSPPGSTRTSIPGGAGLPEWTKADRSIENTDIVLWYTLGNHHIPRPEDWPVMPAERVGFALKPFGFFDVNPSLDVPPSHGPAGR